MGTTGTTSGGTTGTTGSDSGAYYGDYESSGLGSTIVPSERVEIEMPSSFASKRERIAGVALRAVNKIASVMVNVLMKGQGGLKYVVDPSVVDAYRALGKTAFAGGIPQPCPCQACADNRGEWGLFPKPMVQGVYYQFVADHAGVFTPAQVITLEMATRRIFEEVRVPFSVVSIVHLVNKKKLKGRTARYARGMFNNWHIGYKDWNYGMLLLYAAHDGAIALVPGSGWPDSWVRLVADVETTLNHVLESQLVSMALAQHSHAGSPKAAAEAYARDMEEAGPLFQQNFPALLVRVVAALAIKARQYLEDKLSSIPDYLVPDPVKWPDTDVVRTPHTPFVFPSNKVAAKERKAVVASTIMPFASGSTKGKGKEGKIDIDLEDAIASIFGERHDSQEEERF